MSATRAAQSRSAETAGQPPRKAAGPGTADKAGRAASAKAATPKAVTPRTLPPEAPAAGATTAKSPAAKTAKAKTGTAKTATAKTATAKTGTAKAGTAKTAAGTARPARVRPEPAPLSPETRDALIREAAYYRAERRGFAEGDPGADWVAAEAEIDQMLAAAPDPAPAARKPAGKRTAAPQA